MGHILIEKTVTFGKKSLEIYTLLINLIVIIDNNKYLINNNNYIINNNKYLLI